MTPQDFAAMITTLATLNGVDEDTAGDWLALIGDTPEFADDTHVQVPDGSGRLILWPLD